MSELSDDEWGQVVAGWKRDADSARETAELALLGFALHNPFAYQATVERYRIDADHFADGLNRRVFGEIAKLMADGATPDGVAVQHMIGDLEGDTVIHRLTEYIEHACVSGNAGWWADHLRNYRARRAVVTAAQAIGDCAQQGDVDGAVEAAAKAAAIVEATRRAPQAVHLRVLLTEWMAHLAYQNANSVARPRWPGWPGLDAHLGGLLPGELMVLGGPASSGKSALIRCMAVDLGEDGQDVGIVSVEDKKDTWLSRAVADRSGVDVARLRGARLTAGDWGPVTKAAGQLAGLPGAIRLHALRPGSPVGDVLAAMRGVTVAPGTWLFVDYLQAIRSGDPRGRHAELSDSLAAIKGEADRLGARLIVASQQNREGIREGRGDGGPRLASLKETGDAEVMAEAVAILWCKDKHVDRQDHGLDCMELHVVKAKNGRRGVVPLRWDGPRTHYEEAST